MQRKRHRQMTAKKAQKGQWSSKKPKKITLDQWLFFGRNIGQLTPRILYFNYLRIFFSGSKYPKNSLFNFEKRCTALDAMLLFAWFIEVLRNCSTQIRMIQIRFIFPGARVILHRRLVSQHKTDEFVLLFCNSRKGKPVFPYVRIHSHHLKLCGLLLMYWLWPLIKLI